MIEALETGLELAFALFGLLLFAMVLGLAIDNHARSLDPASPYYTQQAR
jgi:hypothetical protein